MACGDVNRATAATALNAHSSRSHAAVIVRVEQRARQDAQHKAADGGGLVTR